MTTPVQWTAQRGGTLHLAAPATAGNTLVLLTNARGILTNVLVYPPTGYTVGPEGVKSQINSDSNSVCKKTAVGGEQDLAVPGGNDQGAAWIELPGLWDWDVHNNADGGLVWSGTAHSGTITPTAGSFLVAACTVGTDGGWGTHSYSVLAGWTEALDWDSATDHPSGWLGFIASALAISYEAAPVCDAAGYWCGIITALVQAPALPEPGIWVDIAGDGFDDGTTVAPGHGKLARLLPEAGTTGGISDNITDYVKKVTWGRPGDPSHSGATPGDTCTLICNNSDGRFTTTNPASPYYGLLRPNRPVWIGINEDGTLYYDAAQTVHGLWAGKVNKVVPMPTPGYFEAPEAQIICDGIMVPWRKRKVRVEFSESRTVATFRGAILDELGVDDANRDLADEPLPLKYSGALSVNTERISLDSLPAEDRTRLRPQEPVTDALALLEELCRITGTRHAIVPADRKEDWFLYTTFRRGEKLTATADASWINTDISGMDGYEISSDGVVNAQEVTYTPVNVDGQKRIVWRYADVPFGVDLRTTKIIIAQYGDFVFDVELDIAGSTGLFTPDGTVVNYGDGAVIQVGARLGATVTKVELSGRRVVRLDSQTYIAADMASQSDTTGYGRRDGQTIQSDYLQTPGMAEGIANFLVWKFANPLATPNVTLKNRVGLTGPRKLYDVVNITHGQTHLTARRMEIVGFSGTILLNTGPGGKVYVEESVALQETPNQSPLNIFTVASSVIGGTDILGY